MIPNNDLDFINKFNNLSRDIIILRNKKLYKECDELIHVLLDIIFRFTHINKSIFTICLFFDNDSITFLNLPNDNYLYKIIKNRYKIDDSDVVNVIIKII
ncbi:hypothetical protein AMV008 [Betaentomopoxvirus amoorei]|uniref:AMV008 n=1 Tax=Amsacta moorei entomopoxvirus TaxID=28321 RepID=Q9EN38_AMEPV|nr:hypothetical protein AMV008 [Amsacta moorei entomopoxvirus]AAG02714.1 AMV008 [Amsacta moorei entomopoxvirus]